MKSVVSLIKFLVITLVFLGILGAFVYLYPYIFSRTVQGEVLTVERVNLNVALMQGAGGANEKLSSELYSFAIAIKEKSGEIVTSSAEDRQWAAVQSGQCAVAKYYPYPPWVLDKAGTYHKARLLKLFDCGVFNNEP